MTRLTDDDENLINFLRQNSPEVPPASPDLEWQICQQIKVAPIERNRYRFPLWLMQPAMAAGLLAFMIGYPSFAPSKPSPAEMAKLEAFMESNWQATVGDNLDNDIWHLTDLSGD
jgi:hypothetical protein